jgi:hypothetical protein
MKYTKEKIEIAMYKNSINISTTNVIPLSQEEKDIIYSVDRGYNHFHMLAGGDNCSEDDLNNYYNS